jgi:hypothetical protein
MSEGSEALDHSYDANHEEHPYNHKIENILNFSNKIHFSQDSDEELEDISLIDVRDQIIDSHPETAKFIGTPEDIQAYPVYEEKIGTDLSNIQIPKDFIRDKPLLLPHDKTLSRIEQRKKYYRPGFNYKRR